MNISAPAGMMDRFAGRTYLRTVQLGFPAELTSTFDADTGYSWKRLRLDTSVPEVNDPTIQPTGNKAFTPDNDESLTSGTVGWMEPDVDVGGWFFIAGGSSSGISTSSKVGGNGSAELVFASSANQGSWVDCNIAGWITDLSIPSAGTYLLWIAAHTAAYVTALSGGGSVGDSVILRIYDETNAAVIGGGAVGANPTTVTTSSARYHAGASMTFVSTFTGAATLRLEAIFTNTYSSTLGFAYLISGWNSNVQYGGTNFGYVKLA